MMNIEQPYNAYATIQNQSKAENASPIEIVCMLYEGAISRLIQAKILLQQENIPILRREEIAAKLERVAQSEALNKPLEDEDQPELVAFSQDLEQLANESEAARRYMKTINGAIQILQGLQGALDFSEDEHQIAEYLDEIYTYCIDRIAVADASRDPGVFDEVIGHIKTIKEAWDEIAKKSH